MPFCRGDLHIRGLRIHDYHGLHIRDLRGHDLQVLQTNDNFLWSQELSWNPLPEFYTLLYIGRAAGLEPELVNKLAALPRYQIAIPAL
jgi:hypothetical protein